MNVWAITGGIACGKSTVARLFGELGATVRSADDDARAARADPDVRAKILAALGTVEPDALSKIIFADPESRKTLNGILHPEVRTRMRAAIDEARRAPDAGLLLYEVPLLYEGGLETWFDGVICAAAAPDVQRARLKSRHPELSGDEIERRIAAQIPADEKARRADVVIRTDGPIEGTRDAVAALWTRLAGG